jgi:5-methylthioadenosine/S-adenosylhomocysteine deaminase
VDTTIVDGRVVMRGRKFLTIDEDEVLSQANRAFDRVLDRMVVPSEFQGEVTIEPRMVT